MLNVILYFQHSSNPLQLYSYRAFPQFTLTQRRLGLIGYTEELFPNQLKYLKGYIFRVLHDYSEPNTILYRDASGREHLTGFMWRFIKSFAANIGADLIPKHPTWPAGRLLSESHILEFTRNGSVDFGLVTVSVKTHLRGT